MDADQKKEELINPVSYLKSIAIAMMLFHHLFLSSYMTEASAWSSIFGFPKIELTLASFGKICVGIFAFITGYFMCKNDKSKKLSYRVSKIALLLKKYWLYCLIFLVIGVVLGEPLPDLKTLLFNLFGFGIKVFDYGAGYICVSHAWYVSFYIAAMLLLVPLLNYLKKRKLILQAFIMVAMVILLNAFAGVLSGRVSDGSYILFLTNAIYEFTRYGLVVAIGYWVCEYNLFDIIWKKTSLKVRGGGNTSISSNNICALHKAAWF